MLTTSIQIPSVGVPMRVVSELLGHSSTRITEDVYSHVTARLAEESARALDRAL
jgi:integrase